MLKIFGALGKKRPLPPPHTQSENPNLASAPRDDLSGIFKSASVVSHVGLISTDSLTPNLAAWVAEKTTMFSLVNPVPRGTWPPFPFIFRGEPPAKKKRQRPRNHRVQLGRKSWPSHTPDESPRIRN
jgi:hypothetical protein